MGHIDRRTLLGAAASLGAGAAAAQPRPITVFAAASLTEALEAVGRAWRSGGRPAARFSFASSAVVARQIEAGAQADLFISADREWMNYLQARDLIQPTTRRDLLGGRLALIAPAASPVRLQIGPEFSLARALGRRGRLAIGDPATVPAGRYAQAALTGLGVWDSVAGRVVGAENVRAALAYVARQEAELGVVYETDARIEPRVRVVDLFPAGSHPPIVYPAALTRRAQPAARAFNAFLDGREAQTLFRRFGFTRA